MKFSGTLEISPALIRVGSVDLHAALKMYAGHRVTLIVEPEGGASEETSERVSRETRAYPTDPDSEWAPPGEE